MKVLKQDTSWYTHPTFFVPLIILCVTILFLGGCFVWWKQTYAYTIADRVYIDSVPVGGLTPDQAMHLLYEHYTPSVVSISLTAGEYSKTTTSTELGIFKPYQTAVASAYQVGRSSSFITNIHELGQLLFHEKNFTVAEKYDNDKVIHFVKEVASVVDQEGTFPAATRSQTGDIIIVQGKMGAFVDIPQTIENIQSAQKNKDLEIAATVVTTGKILNETEMQEAKTRAALYGSKKISFTDGLISYHAAPEEILSTLAFPLGFQDKNVDALIEKVNTFFTIEPRDAEFSVDEKTLKVDQFQPEIVGKQLQKDVFTAQFSDLLQKIPSLEETDISQTVPLTQFAPKITLASLNTLGINEVIGFGESYYDHSIPSRIHNVSTANKIVNNTIVAPGKEFSFNKTLGEVSQKTGFQQAYVIRAGATVLGDGGGVCQVSTTLFRALLDAGLNITKRKAHSYRVSYYELDNDPGFDATVYAGDVDLRFINDTNHHILLTFEDDPQLKYMSVHIYGTPDGRTSEVSNYQKWGYQNPPPAQYIDDPTLPTGKVIQIDWAVAGIKAKFTHTVRDKSGAVIYENEYYSNYIPWSAKYRRGTGV